MEDTNEEMGRFKATFIAAGGTLLPQPTETEWQALLASRQPDARRHNHVTQYASRCWDALGKDPLTLSPSEVTRIGQEILGLDLTGTDGEHLREKCDVFQKLSECAREVLKGETPTKRKPHWVSAVWLLSVEYLITAVLAKVIGKDDDDLDLPWKAKITPRSDVAQWGRKMQVHRHLVQKNAFKSHSPMKRNLKRFYRAARSAAKKSASKPPVSGSTLAKLAPSETTQSQHPPSTQLPPPVQVAPEDSSSTPGDGSEKIRRIILTSASNPASSTTQIRIMQPPAQTSAISDAGKQHDSSKPSSPQQDKAVAVHADVRASSQRRPDIEGKLSVTFGSQFGDLEQQLLAVITALLRSELDACGQRIRELEARVAAQNSALSAQGAKHESTLRLNRELEQRVGELSTPNEHLTRENALLREQIQRLGSRNEEEMARMRAEVQKSKNAIFSLSKSIESMTTESGISTTEYPTVRVPAETSPRPDRELKRKTIVKEEA